MAPLSLKFVYELTWFPHRSPPTFLGYCIPLFHLLIQAHWSSKLMVILLHWLNKHWEIIWDSNGRDLIHLMKRIFTPSDGCSKFLAIYSWNSFPYDIFSVDLFSRLSIQKVIVQCYWVESKSQLYHARLITVFA